MLKHAGNGYYCPLYSQPPSGGCVLKLPRMLSERTQESPAAFRRLCVETREETIMAILTTTSRLQAAVC